MSENEINLLKEWALYLRNISEFVQVGRLDGIKFIVRTNENSGHHKPHLHVETASASMSIAIDDGEILAKSGKIAPVQIKEAQNWMKKNKGLITSKCNEFSNGIEITIKP